jgi:hypothetical protein
MSGLSEEVRAILNAAPHLSMVRPDNGCRAINRNHVGGRLSGEEIDAVEAALAEAGRVERRLDPQSRGLRAGRRIARARGRTTIWHVPLAWLDAPTDL